MEGTDSTVTVIGGVEVDWASERGRRALDVLWRLVAPDRCDEGRAWRKGEPQ